MVSREVCEFLWTALTNAEICERPSRTGALEELQSEQSAQKIPPPFPPHTLGLLRAFRAGHHTYQTRSAAPVPACAR